MKILFRADASTAIGAGHVMRCLALAETAIQRGHKPVFLSAQMLSSLKQRMRSKKIQFVTQKMGKGDEQDALATARLATRGGYDCVVADHYGIGGKFQSVLKRSGIKQLLLDDDGKRDAYVSNFVLNQNIYASPKMYRRRPPATRLLLGSRFALIRDEFIKQKDRNRSVRVKATRLLVTLGGSDPRNTTLKVVRAIERILLTSLDVIVVVGPGYRHLPQLEAACRRLKFSWRIEKSPSSMAPLMSWADIAVSAAGSTSWELSFMGVPSILIIVAENQKLIGRTLEKKGAVLCAGEAKNVSSSRLAKMIERLMGSYAMRKKMSRVLHGLVDGHGTHRVLRAIAA